MKPPGDLLRFLAQQPVQFSDAVLSVDLPYLVGYVPRNPVAMDRFIRNLLQALKQAIIGQGKTLGKNLRGYYSLKWNSGLNTHLDLDMRIIDRRTADGIEVLAIGPRLPGSVNDVYRSASQRLKLEEP